jgi:hypothetical protein
MDLRFTPSPKQNGDLGPVDLSPKAVNSIKQDAQSQEGNNMGQEPEDAIFDPLNSEQAGQQATTPFV